MTSARHLRRTLARAIAHDGGAAAVEFALVLPLLLMLVLGAIDWGWYFFLREVVTNASREGARAGAVTITESPADFPLVTDAAENAANDYLTNLGLSGNHAVATTSGANVYEVSVVVTYPVGSITGFTLPGYASLVPTQIQATTQMRIEGY